MDDGIRLLLKAHVKGHYRHVNGKVVYIADHDDARPQGRAAALHERTAVGQHKDGSHYVRATDAEDAKAIKAAADKHGITIEKRRRGAIHHGRMGAYDHFHVGSLADAARIHQELEHAKPEGKSTRGSTLPATQGGPRGAQPTPLARREAPGSTRMEPMRGHVDASGAYHGTAFNREGHEVKVTVPPREAHDEGKGTANRSSGSTKPAEKARHRPEALGEQSDKADHRGGKETKGSSQEEGRAGRGQLKAAEAEADKLTSTADGHGPSRWGMDRKAAMEAHQAAAKARDQAIELGGEREHHAPIRDRHLGQAKALDQEIQDQHLDRVFNQQEAVPFSRKPANENEIGKTWLTPEQRKGVQDLIARGKVIPLSSHGMAQDLPQAWVEAGKPQFFVGKSTTGRVFLVDTQGGNYVRYAVGLDPQVLQEAKNPDQEGSAPTPAETSRDGSQVETPTSPSVQPMKASPSEGEDLAQKARRHSGEAEAASGRSHQAHEDPKLHEAAHQAHQQAAAAFRKAAGEHGVPETQKAHHEFMARAHEGIASLHANALERFRPPKSNTHTAKSIGKLKDHEDYEGFGYFGHRKHDPSLDAAVAEAANHHGLDRHQVTAFLHGRSGRHAMDVIDRNIPKATALQLKQLAKEDEDAAGEGWNQAVRDLPHKDKVDHFKQWMDPKGSKWKEFGVEGYAQDLRLREEVKGARAARKALGDPQVLLGDLHHTTLSLNEARHDPRNLLKALGGLQDLDAALPFQDAYLRGRAAGIGGDRLLETIRTALGGSPLDPKLQDLVSSLDAEDLDDLMPPSPEPPPC